MTQFGYRLLQKELIDEEQLSSAIARQQLSGELLACILVESGFVTEKQLVNLFAREYKIPYMTLENYKANREAVRLIDEAFARKHCLIPIELAGNALSVAMVDPTKTDTLATLSQMTGCSVQPFVSLLSEVRKAVAQSFCQETPEICSDKEAVERGEQEQQKSISNRLNGDVNRRSFPRVACCLPIMLVFEDPECYILSVQANDLSLHGLSCSLPEPLTEGASVSVWLELPHALRMRTQGQGHVVRVGLVKEGSNPEYQAGISFGSLCEQSKSAITHYLQSNQRRW